MRIAYLDCFSGISGDMFLGALMDSGVPVALFHETIAALNAAGGLEARLEVGRVERCGIQAAKAEVFVAGVRDEPRVEHHHAHDHHHGHAHEHAHESVLGETHGAHGSAAAHQHEKTAPPGALQPKSHDRHRGLTEIHSILEQAGISAAARRLALAIFQALGEAEAKVHGIAVEDVHFHEVGAADAIVDITCAAAGSLELGVEEWVCSPLNLGSGSVECAHGRFPVPAPATMELLRGAPVFSSGVQAELVTPTGAAIVKTLAARFASLPQMKISKIGYGAGSRDFSGHANVLRLLTGEAQAERATGATREAIAVLECTVDDMNPQIIGYVLERARAAGALDSYALSAQMKKSRPGALITVLARPQHAAQFADLLLRETSSLGVRMREEQRWRLPRRQVVVNTVWGPVHVKLATLEGEVANAAPEFEDCRKLAEQHQVPLKRVMQAAMQALAQDQEEEKRTLGLR